MTVLDYAFSIFVAYNQNKQREGAHPFVMGPMQHDETPVSLRDYQFHNVLTKSHHWKTNKSVYLNKQSSVFTFQSTPGYLSRLSTKTVHQFTPTNSTCPSKLNKLAQVPAKTEYQEAKPSPIPRFESKYSLCHSV